MENNRRAQLELLLENYQKIIAAYDKHDNLPLTRIQRQRFDFERGQLEATTSRIKAELGGQTEDNQLPPLEQYQTVLDTSQIGRIFAELD